MSGAHLAGRKVTFGAVIESHEDRCEIFHTDLDVLQFAVSARLESFQRAARLLPPRNHGCDISKHMRDAQTGHVLREVTPVRPDIAESR